jgi:MFS family permease
MLVGAIVATVGFTGTALAYNLYDLILWRSLCALGYAMVFVAAQGYVLDRTGQQNRRRASRCSSARSWWRPVCGPSIGGILADNIGFRAAFGVSAVMSLLSILAIARLPAHRRCAAPRSALARAAHAGSHGAHHQPALHDAHRAWRRCRPR